MARTRAYIPAAVRRHRASLLVSLRGCRLGFLPGLLHQSLSSVLTMTAVGTEAALVQTIIATDSLLLTPLSLEDQETLLRDIGDDLGFMWESLKIPQEVRAKLSQLGFTELEVWAMATETKAGMREIIKKSSASKKMLLNDCRLRRS